jgi:hypothetical protein
MLRLVGGDSNQKTSNRQEILGDLFSVTKIFMEKHPISCPKPFYFLYEE